MKNADGLLMRSVIVAVGYIVLVLTIASIPPPSPIADRIEASQQIQLKSVLQRHN